MALSLFFIKLPMAKTTVSHGPAGQAGGNSQQGSSSDVGYELIALYSRRVEGT